MSIHPAHKSLGWALRHRLEDCLPAMVMRLQNDSRAWYRENGFPWTEPQESLRAAT